MPDRLVLLVDDSHDDVYLTLHTFGERRFPYKIDVAHDGAEALDYLFCRGKYESRNKSENPIAILLDLKMPKIGGLEVLRRVRAEERLKHIRVIVLTSSDEERDRTEAQKLGADLYIRKPENLEQFGEVAHQVETLLSST
jgi:two-component system, response regulator